jgi:hypothetical protein
MSKISFSVLAGFLTMRGKFIDQVLSQQFVRSATILTQKKNKTGDTNMFSLQDLLGQQQGGEALNEISQNVGADSSMVNTAIQMALPALMGGLANNASTPEGAESLNNALAHDNHAGVLDNIGGLAGMIFGSQQAAPPPRQADAGGILGHILGSNQGQVAQEVSQKSGLNMGQVAQILMFLAPIVMGYLGRQKQQQGVGADGLGGLLGGLLGGGQAAQQQSSGNPMIDMATSALDRDGDGSSLDDIASMAFNYINNR